MAGFRTYHPGMGQNAGFAEDRIIIAGVGLIGGSIAAAVRKRSPNTEVIGIGRSPDRLRQATEIGLLTGWATQLDSRLLSGRTLAVVCLPVDMIASTVREMAELASSDVLLTDAGSVKASVCDEILQDSRAADLFIGSHPIAGGENGGFEFSDSDLFRDRVCVVTADPARDGGMRLNRLRDFWKFLGARVEFMSAEDHDHVLALTSHLPHLMAAVTTNCVGPQNLPLTGSGFRDTTRVAAGSPSLWRTIFAGNRSSVVEAVAAAQRQLNEFQLALESRDDDRVEDLLRQASECRKSLDHDASRTRNRS
ncbi:MAG: prephenate dehydrogenase [Planctomycetaceae bacterium]